MCIYFFCLQLYYTVYIYIHLYFYYVLLLNTAEAELHALGGPVLPQNCPEDGPVPEVLKHLLV